MHSVIQRFFKNSPRTFIIGAILLITLLASFLRFYKLADAPPVFNPDEASIAYNAYLLHEVGRDEWEKPWPLVLEAFGDQKIGGYTYLTVASFALFGVSEFSVRLPAALASIDVVLVSGLLVYLLYRNKREENKQHNGTPLALVTMAIISIQPVFIWYGRVAFEATVALLCTLVILVLLLSVYPRIAARALKTKQLLVVVSIILLMTAAVFFYNVPLIILPFIFLPVPVWYGLRKWRVWLPVVTVGAITWALLMLSTQGLTAQKSRITLFGDPTIQAEQNQYYLDFENPLQQKLLGNKYVFYAREVSERFIASLSPEYIVHNTNGHPWHAFPGSGYLTTPVYFLGWIGVLGTAWTAWTQWRKSQVSKETKVRLLMIYLTLISLVPSIITVNAPHATRTLLFFVGWVYFSALGVMLIINLMQNLRSLHRGFSIATILVLSVIISWPSALYAQSLLSANHSAEIWGTGLRAGLPEIIAQVEGDYSENQTIAVHDTRGFSYIMFAWYTRMDPDTFFSTVQRSPPDTINFKYGSRAGRYVFVQDKAYFQAENKYVPIIFWEDSWQLYDAKVEEEKMKWRGSATKSATIQQ